MYFLVPSLLLSSRMEVGKKVTKVYDRWWRREWAEKFVIILLRCFLSVNCVSVLSLCCQWQLLLELPPSKQVLLSILAQTVRAICDQASHRSEADLLHRTFHKYSYGTVLST